MRSPLLRRSFLLTTTLLAFTASLCQAHLALIRQGVESAEVPNADDRFGSNVVTGDFDNDGFDDLASAATWESNSLVNAEAHGIVLVNFGTSLGLTHNGASVLSPGDPGDLSIKYGFGMAVGDFNGDNHDDLAVGAPELDTILADDTGGVFIYDGYASGIQLAASLFMSESDVGAAEEENDLFGWAMTAGDFNGDNFDDLAIGGIGENFDLGAVYVVYSAGISGLDPATTDIFTPHTLGYTPFVDGGWFGYSLASADFDQDNRDDLVVGAPRTDVLGVVDSGRLYFLYGSPAGITSTGNWVWDHSTTTLDIDEELELGWSLVTGHFHGSNNDSPMSVVAGAPAFAHQGNANAGGTAWVTHDDVTRGPGGSASFGGQDAGLSYDDVFPNDRYGSALAAGDFNQDGFDDVGIGVPSDNLTGDPGLGTIPNSGSAYYRLGGAGGLGSKNHITHETLNDHLISGDNLGAALAMGDFDGNGRDAIAIGAPFADWVSYDGGSNISNAGQVYIYAPWRQPQNRPHRGSTALNCDGRFVYTKRAWQRMRPASTTKTMTLKLACEALQNGQDPTQLFQVPPWIASGPGGSQVPLFANELLSFEDLMRTMMTVSGNDAAMLLATIMSGQGNSWEGWEDTSPAFAASMEAKANQLGMSSSTSFTNAAGIDAGDHYTTPADFAWMAYQTIQDNCVKETVDTSPWLVTRFLPGNLWGGFFNQFLPVQMQFFNGFVDGVKSRIATGVGNKGGQTPGALRTGTYNSEPNPLLFDGMTAASGFGVWDDGDPFPNVSADCNTCLGAELLAVAESSCSGLNDYVLPPDPPPSPWGTLTYWDPIEGDPPVGMTFPIAAKEDTDPGRITQIDVLRRTFETPTTAYRQVIHRVSEVCIATGGTEAFGVAPYQQHQGFRVVNRGETSVDLVISMTDPTGSSRSLTLLPDAEITLAPASGNPSSSFSMTILNQTVRQTAVLEVEELGYLFEITLGDGTAAPDVSSIALTRSLETKDETVSVFLEGRDPVGGNFLDLVAHEPTVTTAVELAPTTPQPAQTALLPSYPNPFNPVTTIRFDLPHAGPVNLAIYDTKGRLVSQLYRGENMTAGRHQLQWHGLDDRGARVASGVYLLKFAAQGIEDSQRLVLVK